MCIYYIRYRFTHHHSEVYSYFIEIAMSPPNLICCNNLGDEDYLHLDTCICKAKRQFVKANATKKPFNEQSALCKPPDEERVLFFYHFHPNTPAVHPHIFGLKLHTEAVQKIFCTAQITGQINNNISRKEVTSYFLILY